MVSPVFRGYHWPLLALSSYSTWVPQGLRPPDVCTVAKQPGGPTGLLGAPLAAAGCCPKTGLHCREATPRLTNPPSAPPTPGPVAGRVY